MIILAWLLLVQIFKCEICNSVCFTCGNQSAVFLNEVWNHVYFTDDNLSIDFSALLICGILHISYKKIVDMIF